MKKIWIINQYNMPPEYGHLNRHYNFGKYLKRLGFEPTVFVGSFLHNTKIQMIKGNKTFIKYENCEFPYYFVKTCDYSASKLKRVYAMFEFYANLFKAAKKLDKPDVIIGSSAHPLNALAALRLAKKFGCRSVIEVRDLWPESFVAYRIIKRNNPLLKLMYAGEKWIYKNAERLVFTMEGGKDYIVEKGWDLGHSGPIDLNKVYHVNNGVDLETFEYNRNNSIISDEDLDDDKTFKVIYTGSIRRANNVKCIVDAARIIKTCTNDIKIIIFGDGDNRKYLENYCAENGIANVVFKGFVDKKYIPYILSRSDLNILHYDESNLKKYGASLNKLFEYFASGKPTVSDCDFGYDLIKRYNCGIVADDASAGKLADTIIRFSNMPYEQYREYCSNALTAARDYDFEILAEKLVEII